jgi:T5orf172 domain
LGSTADEMPPTYSTGWIYVLENERMPTLFKIGFTKNAVEQRVAELSNHTGVPLPFVCVFRCRVRGPAEVEKAVHQVLACHNAGKEFFQVSVDVAIAAIEQVVLDQQKQLSEVWRHAKYLGALAPLTRGGRTTTAWPQRLSLAHRNHHHHDHHLHPSSDHWERLRQDNSLPKWFVSATLVQQECGSPSRVTGMRTIRTWTRVGIRNIKRD